MLNTTITALGRLKSGLGPAETLEDGSKSILAAPIFWNDVSDIALRCSAYHSRIRFGGKTKNILRRNIMTNAKRTGVRRRPEGRNRAQGQVK